MGTLAAALEHTIAFAYDKEWLADGFSLNPGIKDIMAVADNIKLNHQKALGIAERIQDIVQKELGALIKRRG